MIRRKGAGECVACLYVLAALAVMGLAFWAYQENYKTQAGHREVREPARARSASAHERLSVLRAEWAYLNRPDRLADLADLNFDRLGLLPLMPDAFGAVDQIIYPLPPILPITNPIELSCDQLQRRWENDAVTRTPLRPLARILKARAKGENPDAIEPKTCACATRRWPTSTASAPKAGCWCWVLRFSVPLA